MSFSETYILKFVNCNLILDEKIDYENTCVIIF